jgi:phosphate transport system substrate-binding protein
LFVYVNAHSLRHPATRQFIDHYLEHAGDLARRVGYFPLPEEIYQRVRENVAHLRTGTHFVTAEGEAREGTIASVFRSENLVKAVSHWEH